MGLPSSTRMVDTTAAPMFEVVGDFLVLAMVQAFVYRCMFRVERKRYNARKK